MQDKLTHRAWLIAEIESETSITHDWDAWTTNELQDTYDTLIGSMYNGITWRTT